MPPVMTKQTLLPRSGLRLPARMEARPRTDDGSATIFASVTTAFMARRMDASSALTSWSTFFSMIRKFSSTAWSQLVPSAMVGEVLMLRACPAARLAA